MDLLSIFCVMGMPTLDNALQGLIEAMDNAPQQLGSMTAMAKSIGCCIALGVAANECYQMMLGKRGLDVLKLIHILIISMCISFSGSIVSMAKAPGKSLEKQAKAMMEAKAAEVTMKEEQVAELQRKYIEHINNIIAEGQIQREENRTESSVVPGVDAVRDAVDDFIYNAKNTFMKAAIYAETKICEWASLIIRFIGEIIFQMSYFGMLIAQRIFMALLALVCPLMFAISLSPHFKSAWSQWLSKFLSLSLWGFVTYICLYYVNFILIYTLDQDITAYGRLMAETTSLDWEKVGAIGMQGLGTTCMYVVSLMIGSFVIRMVPEAASWLIPGGVSSSAGEKSGGVGMGAVTGAASAAGGFALGAAGAAASAPGKMGTYIAKVGGTMDHGGEGGRGTSIISAIAQNTKIGQAYDAGRKRGQSGSSSSSSPKSKP